MASKIEGIIRAHEAHLVFKTLEVVMKAVLLLLLVHLYYISAIKVRDFNHPQPRLAIVEERSPKRSGFKRGGVQGFVKNAGGNEVATLACLIYTSVKVATELIRLRWPRFLAKYRSASASDIAKEQEELWSIVDKIYRGHEERLNDLSNSSSVAEAAFENFSNMAEDAKQEVDSVKHAFSQLSDRMIALESSIGKASKQTNSGSSTAEELKAFKADVAAKLKRLEATGAAQSKGAATAGVGKEVIGDLEKKIAVLQAQNKVQQQAIAAEQAKLAAAVNAVRDDLPKVLKDHDEKVATKLKAYGEELKSVVAAASTAAGAAKPKPKAKPAPKPKPKPRGKR